MNKESSSQEFVPPSPPDKKGRPKEIASGRHTPFKGKFPRGPQFTVRVSKEIMEHARVRDSSHCMVAMAVRDVMPQATSPAVDIQTIRFSDREKGLRYTYLTPRIAQVAIIQFDQGVMPEPFSFRLHGAHVTKIVHKPKAQTPRAMSEGQKRGLLKAHQVRHGKGANLDKLKLTLGSDGERLPRRVGGVPPPLSNFARRREFGLRALKV